MKILRLTKFISNHWNRGWERCSFLPLRFPRFKFRARKTRRYRKQGKLVPWRGLFTRCIDSPEQVPPGRPTSPPRIVVQPRPRPRPCWPLTTSRKPLQARSMSPFQLDPYCRPFLQQTVCHVIREKSFQGISQSGFLGRAIFERGKI